MQTIHITPSLTPTTTCKPTRSASATPSPSSTLVERNAGISTSPPRRPECAPFAAMAIQLEHGGHAQEPGDHRSICNGYEGSRVMHIIPLTYS